MSENADTHEKQVTVHPLKLTDMERFRSWGHHTDLRFQGYDFPDLTSKKGRSTAKQKMWFYKRSIPSLRWLYGIEDPSGNLAGYFKIVKKSVLQKKAELTMILDPASMGKRYGTEAFAPLLSVCFDELHLEEVWVRVLAFNVRPLRLLEKSGFVCFKIQLEPYFDQKHTAELLERYPDDFSMTADRLMTHYCYLKLTNETFENLRGSERATAVALDNRIGP